jgi:hypothetical protein
VKKRAEVDDHVEGAVVERHPADVGCAELRRGPVLEQTRRRLVQQIPIDVETHQPCCTSRRGRAPPLLDLVRHDLLMSLKPMKRARIETIVDELFLPLATQQADN